jgi:hypothetical protein
MTFDRHLNKIRALKSTNIWRQGRCVFTSEAAGEKEESQSVLDTFEDMEKIYRKDISNTFRYFTGWAAETQFGSR